MAEHGDADCAARPVVAGEIQILRPSPALRGRTGQHVVLVRRPADAGDYRAALSQRRGAADLGGIAVQFVDVLGDLFALEVHPGALADAVAGIDRAAARVGAEVSAPGLAARAGALRQGLAMAVRTFQAAQVGALAG